MPVFVVKAAGTMLSLSASFCYVTAYAHSETSIAAPTAGTICHRPFSLKCI